MKIKKTVLITGASSGIGYAVAEAFLKLGANVVLNARNEEKLLQAVEKLGETDKIVAIPGEIGNKKTSQKMVQEALRKFGRVDILVNNAGMYKPKPFTEYTEQDLDDHLSSAIKGTFFASQAVVDSMRKQGGAIINIGAATVTHAFSKSPASAAMAGKGGIHALTTSLATELAPYNIRVNTIAPMIIRTPMHDPKQVDSLGAIHPLNRIGEQKDIVDTVLYLAEANFTTGVILPVDGGFIAGH